MFSVWDLFSFQIRTDVIDVSCDSGKSFLIRDYHDKNEIPRYRRFLIYHNLVLGNLKHPSLHHIGLFDNTCVGVQPEVFMLKGSLYEHMFKKENLTVLSRKFLE